MKEKIKKIVLGHLPGFITGLIICGWVSVLAMTYFPSNQTTYDNSISGLQSENVQDAIDELYNTCFPSKTRGEARLDRVKPVTSGNGLYEDEYEEGKYTYKGANPNNYVTFNNDKAQGQIIDGTYYVGGIIVGNNDMRNQINDEKSTTSKVKVALPTVSEYIRAESNTSCKTFSNYISNYNTCKNSDWMYINGSWWTLSPVSGDSYGVFYLYLDGSASLNYIDDTINSNFAIRPTVTLSSEVQITGGSGTESDPYILS